MPITKEATLYTFDELSERAKETARHWFRSAIDESDLDCVIEDVATIADILGIDLRQRPVKLMSGATRYDPDISYSVGFCQSDYAAFDGQYRYKKGAAKAIRAYAPKDAELHAVADGLQSLQRTRFYRLTARCSAGRAYQQVETFDNGDYADSATTDSMTELLRNFAAWIYAQLRAEVEYQHSDKCIDENILANEYTFDQDGNRED